MNVETLSWYRLNYWSEQSKSITNKAQREKPLLQVMFGGKRDSEVREHVLTQVIIVSHGLGSIAESWLGEGL